MLTGRGYIQATVLSVFLAAAFEAGCGALGAEVLRLGKGDTNYIPEQAAIAGAMSGGLMSIPTFALAVIVMCCKEGWLTDANDYIGFNFVANTVLCLVGNAAGGDILKQINGMTMTASETLKAGDTGIGIVAGVSLVLFTVLKGFCSDSAQEKIGNAFSRVKSAFFGCCFEDCRSYGSYYGLQ